MPRCTAVSTLIRRQKQTASITTAMYRRRTDVSHCLRLKPSEKTVELSSLIPILRRIKMCTCQAYKFCFRQFSVKILIVSSTYLCHSSTNSHADVVFPTRDVQKCVYYITRRSAERHKSVQNYQNMSMTKESKMLDIYADNQEFCRVDSRDGNILFTLQM